CTMAPLQQQAPPHGHTGAIDDTVGVHKGSTLSPLFLLTMGVTIENWQRLSAENGLNMKKTKFLSSEKGTESIVDGGGKAIEKVQEFRYLLHSAEMKMLRWVCGWTRLDRVRNEDVRTAMQTAPVQLKVREQRLRWFGHVLRRSQSHPIREAIEFEAQGTRSPKEEMAGPDQE
ncbi:hypothetical protein V3C99_010097, partial [Haemonchus contortus]